jgi:phosphatidylserine/phosphatidylglycerophosphate/cardiolipin synthase-like enzyme
MSRRSSARPSALPRDFSPLRTLADQAFSRAAGAPLIAGNRVRVLTDATENYPAWARAIIDARQTIHVEMYIIHRDDVGRRFVELLAARARDGVKVRVIYDWFGCGFGPVLGLFRPLIQAGADVRAFNPPTFTSILGWARRDHRKLIVVDGRVAFVSGLCIGRMWEGSKERGQAPWRDTGIEIAGPAVAHAEQAFADMWRLTGGQPAPIQIPRPDSICWSSPWRENRCGLPTPTFSATARTWKRCAAPRRKEWTCGCCCRRAATWDGRCRCRARCTARCSNRAYASSNGTAR